MSGASTIDGSGASRLGLVVPDARGDGAARGLVDWLVEAAERAGVPADVRVDVVDLADPADRDRDGYVVLVGQYGPVAAPAAEDVVTRYAARWAARPVGLVSYGGVSRGRDAARRIRGLLGELGAVVVEVGLGVNVAELRAEGGPGTFERVGWEMVLDGVAAANRPATAA